MTIDILAENVKEARDAIEQTRKDAQLKKTFVSDEGMVILHPNNSPRIAIEAKLFKEYLEEERKAKRDVSDLADIEKKVNSVDPKIAQDRQAFRTAYYEAEDAIKAAIKEKRVPAIKIDPKTGIVTVPGATEKETTTIKPEIFRSFMRSERNNLRFDIKNDPLFAIEAQMPTLSAEAFRTLPPDAPKPCFIMCKPERELRQQVDIRMRRWEALKDTIESLGGTVVLLPEERKQRNTLDIFTRDPLIVLDDKKLALVPEKPTERYAPNIPGMKEELQRKGYEIKTFTGQVEGGDVIYDPERKLILVGTDAKKPTFTEQDAKKMKELTGCDVMCIPRTTAAYYHLDTAIARLPNGKYLINPSVTDDETYQKLKKKLESDNGTDNVIRIDNHEKYAANLICIGNTLVMPTCSPELRKTLEDDYKFKIVTPEDVGLPADAWNIQDGSVHCMTQQAMLNLKQQDTLAYGNILQQLAQTSPSPTHALQTGISEQLVPKPSFTLEQGRTSQTGIA